MFSFFFDLPKAEAGERIEELLAFVELEGKKNSKIDELSTGMKRRLLIARALLNQPRLITLFAAAYTHHVSRGMIQ